MEIWSKARSFAEAAAKRSQELTSTVKFPDIISETAKRAAEASTNLKSEALNQIKSFSLLENSSSSESSLCQPVISDEELERFGISDELREFVKEIEISTFQDFPLPDDTSVSDVPTVSNVQQDLTEWQAKHALLVLSTVKEISKLRYELCPRVMKERKFWRIYFIIVNSHVASYEKQYMEDLKIKSAEPSMDDKAKEHTKGSTLSKSDRVESSQPPKKSTSTAEQDLDAFLLGDLADSDGPDDGGDGDDGFGDDFDKIDDISEDERAKALKK